eukprot:jgi/Bigna1/65041/fgenesh1_kg.95_\
METSANRYGGGSQKGAAVYMGVSTSKFGSACLTDVPDSVLTNAQNAKPTTCDGSMYTIESGFVCPIVCNPGYRAIGNLICDNGRWTTESFKCSNAPTCSLPSTSNGNLDSALDTGIIGVITSEGCSSITESGTHCYYTCSGNRTGLGQIQCNPDTKWTSGNGYEGCATLSCALNPPPLMCKSTLAYTTCCASGGP